MATNIKTETPEERVQRLCEAGGGLVTPDAVVEDARDPDSPLHEMFEWNDSIAAHQHRLVTARTIIRNIRVEVTIETQRRRVVAYVHDPDLMPGQQGYVPTASLRSSVDRAKSAASQELRRAESALQRAREVATVLELQGPVDEIVQEITDLQETIKRL